MKSTHSTTTEQHRHPEPGHQHGGCASAANSAGGCHCGEVTPPDGAQEHAHGALPGWRRLGAALVLALGTELGGQWLPERWAEPAGMVLALAAIALAGTGVYRSGLQALLRGRFGILALMAVAVTGAFLIGQWAEAGMVMALFVAAEKLEDAAMDKARNAVRELMVQTPATATVIGPDGAPRSEPVALIQPGALLRIAPGERIALDGLVQQGRSAVNQAPVTGESVPVDKAPGDTLFAGSVNTTGELLMQVSHAAGSTVLDRIVQLVEQSQSARAPVQRAVDRFAAVYTPIVMALAALVALALPLLLGWPWLDALYRALALLIIACPCALVIATPVAIVSALGNAARQGVLFKGGQALEKASGIRAIAFDKTGTLTQGKPRLEAWRILPGNTAQAQDSILQTACALAQRSNHPVSRAIAAGLQAHCANEAEIAAQFTQPQASITELPGRGVQAQTGAGPQAGETWKLGNLEWLQSGGADGSAWEADLQVWRQAGFAVTALALDRQVLAIFAVTDTVRPEAPQAVAALKMLGLRIAMLSGDNQQAAGHIAATLGIEQAHGELLPQDKLDALLRLRQQWGHVAMVGDGINDAPALARADLGIAMGGAESADIAAEAADVVLMGNQLRNLPEAFRLARRTHGIVWQNIGAALLGKAIFLALAALGLATMWMAVAADLGISLLVIANGMRLRRWHSREQ